MPKFKYYLKRFGIDAAGYGLILLGLLTGWLPGPGGIPLILGGLGLLSIHNHWARSLLLFAKKYSGQFMDYLFPENPWAKALHDILVVIFISTAIYLFFHADAKFTIAIAISLTAIAVVDFLYNRKRWQRLKRQIK